MSKRSYKVRLALLALAAVAAGGCLLSGTFMVITPFFQLGEVNGVLYYHEVDVTGDATWDKHKDKIDYIDALGFELYITNNESRDVTFNAYVDTYSGVASPTIIPAEAVGFFNGLTVKPGKNHITYAQSLDYITHLTELKAFAKGGKFDIYASADGPITFDSVRAILTVSAGN